MLICGANGSGKSAVLQAIQLCLGARARDTGRSASAKTMIRGYREGAPCPVSSAAASVTIWCGCRLQDMIKHPFVLIFLTNKTKWKHLKIPA